MSIIANTLSQSAFWIINKALVKHLKGDYAAVALLSEIVSLRQLAETSGNLDKDNFFPIISENLESVLCINRHARVKATAVLKGSCLISLTAKKTQTPDKGIQTINWYCVNDDIIEEILREHRGAVCNNFTPRMLNFYPPYVTKHTAYKKKIEREEKEDPSYFSQDETLVPEEATDDCCSTTTSTPEDSDSTPTATKQTVENIVLAWSASLPSRFTNDRPDYLYTLFMEIKEGGYAMTDIDSSLKRRIIDRLVPPTKPKTCTREAYEAWQQIVNSEYDKQIAAVFLPTINLRAAPQKPTAETASVQVTTDIQEISLNMIRGIINNQKQKV